MQAATDKFLSVSVLVEELYKDGLLNQETYTSAKKIRRGNDEQTTHSTSQTAKQDYVNALTTGKTLNETDIIAWLAAKHRMDAYQIDPLEVDVTAVTQIMSYAFSERHQILAVDRKSVV